MRAAAVNGHRATRGASRRERGFTLLEIIVVVAITGVIAASVAIFIRRPVEGYVDTTLRAELSDIADTALRRIARDLRSALPNSIRVATSGTSTYIEYLQLSGGGRYRAETDSGGLGDPLDFSVADGSFDVIGSVPAFAGGESIVIYNVTATGSTANAYTGDNRAAFGSASATGINLGAPKQFPFASPGKRFHVVQYPVTYRCDTATGELRRYWNYPIAGAQPTPPAGGADALLATRLTDCAFTYNAINQRLAVVGLNLQVGSGGGNVRLFQQVHVRNVP